MTKFRILDLGVKIDLARAASRAISATQVTDQTLAGCVFRREMAKKPQTFNKVVSGTLLIDDPELRNLAAALEYIVRFEPTRSLEDDSAAFATTNELTLFPGPILGTIQDFGVGVLKLARPEISASDLSETVRHSLGLGRLAREGEIQPLTIVGQHDRLTPQAAQRRERDIDQPERDPLFLEPLTPVQIFVKPEPAHQVVCAFELNSGADLLTRPWSKAPWLGARYQPAGRPAPLLDADATVGAAMGAYGVQAVGLDLPATFKPPLGVSGRLSDAALLPAEMRQLLRHTPEWPAGYAEIMALLIHAGKTAKKTVAGMRLYRGGYGVRVPVSGGALEG